MPEVTEEIQELPEGLETRSEGEQEGDLEQGGLSFLGDGGEAQALKQWIRTTLDTTSGNQSKYIHESRAHERHEQVEDEQKKNIYEGKYSLKNQNKSIYERQCHAGASENNYDRNENYSRTTLGHYSQINSDGLTERIGYRDNNNNFGHHSQINSDGLTERIGYSDSSNNPTAKLNSDRYNQMNSKGHTERIDYSEWWNHMQGMSSIDNFVHQASSFANQTTRCSGQQIVWWERDSKE
jgi:hypothetical protein